LHPIKKTIYPEFIPDIYRHDLTDSLPDQIITYLIENTDIEIIDLRPALIQKKSDEQIFRRLDTHWNQLGAFYGYQEITKHLQIDFPNIDILSMEDVQPNFQYAQASGDLARTIGMEGILFEEIPLYALPTNSCVEEITYVGLNLELPFHSGTPARSYQCASSMYNAVIFHDSFAFAMIPFLTQNFQTSTYHRGYVQTNYQVSDFFSR